MESRIAVEKKLSLTVASILEAKVRENGEASLLVSGGSTPINMFKELSKYKISWNKVSISLVDERLVAKEHKDSNEGLVRAHLLQNEAKRAQFIPLVINESNKNTNLMEARKLIGDIRKPFSVVILGMGTDGHTASLFPQSPQLKEGMDLLTEEHLIITEPMTAPHDRISFTRKALLNTDYLFLHCYGAEKKEILKEVKERKDKNKYPIGSFIHQDIVDIEIYWAN